MTRKRGRGNSPAVERDGLLSDRAAEASLRAAGVRITRREGLLYLALPGPSTLLSTGSYRGGWSTGASVANLQVPAGFRGSPQPWTRRRLAHLGLPEDSVALLTAVNSRRATVRVARWGRVWVAAIVTAGLTHPLRAGDSLAREGRGARASTINIIVLVGGTLDPSALTNLLATVVEAKCAALDDLDVRSRYSATGATGTITDAVVVAALGGPARFPYGGPGTAVGFHASVTVRAAVLEAVRRHHGWSPGRPVLDRLEERGIRRKDLIEAALKLVVEVPPDRVRRALGPALERATADPNVAALLLGACRLEEEGHAGRLPGLTAAEFAADPVPLIADEDIGEMIGRYLAGTQGIHNFRYYDRHKPGILGELGPFLDDALGGLLGGVMARLFQKE